MDWDPATVPDPQDPQTFVDSKLDWSELGAAAEHADLLDLHRRLLTLRRTYPDLTDPRFDHSMRSLRRRRGLAADRARGDVLVASTSAADADGGRICPGELELLLTVGRGRSAPSDRLGPERDAAAIRLSSGSAIRPQRPSSRPADTALETARVERSATARRSAHART